MFKDRKLYLFDTFEGFDDRDLETENKYEKSYSKYGKFNDTSLEEKFAFVSLEADLYMPTYNGLKYFHPRLSYGGYILLHDYNSTQFPNEKRQLKIIPKNQI